ncbi:MAG: DUF2207 domain-containing protein [Pseudolysinimonas sp.]
MTSLRRLTRIAAVLAASLLLLTGCVLPTPSVSSQSGQPSGTPTADVRDFTFASFDATYQLSRDDGGRSILVTSERLVAEFPEYDENRGIRRNLFTGYDGHPTDLEVLSVTDADRHALAYETIASGDTLSVIVAVPEGQYVHGERTYVITYQQHSVIGDLGDHQELHWEVNGTAWTEPFGTVSARVEVDGALTEHLIRGNSCSFGPIGSTSQCTVDGAGGAFSMTVDNLGPGETMTFAIPFQSGTFSE